MVLGAKAGAARGLVDRDRDRALDRGGRREIVDAPAVRAHEMVVVAGEILGELVAREIGVGHEPVHDPGLFQHHEVPVGRALGERGLRVEDLGNGERPVGGLEHVDDELARRREPLLLGVQQHRDGLVQPRRRGAFAAIACECTGTVVGHGRHGTVRGRGRRAGRGDASRRRRVLSGRARAPGSRRRRQCARLDELARRCPTPTFDGMRAYLFQTLGFRGNTRDYGDPENSFLDSVLERRVGIPISLAVVMMEVGRRIGAPVHGVGMPGHFLVMDAAREGVWCDPFHGGALYDLDGCRRLFARVHGNARGFSRAARADRSARDRRAHARQPRERSPGLRPDGARVDVRAAPELARSAGRPARADLGDPARGALALELVRRPVTGPPSVTMPMFPLGTVLFPYALLPLHVFEPRYRLMMRHVLDGDHEFGVVLIERGSEVGGGDTRFDVATVARRAGGRAPRRALRAGDGRDAAGAGRALARRRSVPARRGRRARRPAGRRRRARARRRRARARDRARAVSIRVSSAPELDADPVRASYEAAAVAPIGPLDAQRVLAAADAGARLDLLAALLEERAVELRARLDLDE